MSPRVRGVRIRPSASVGPTAISSVPSLRSDGKYPHHFIFIEQAFSSNAQAAVQESMGWCAKRTNLGMPQCSEALGKVLCCLSAAHSAAGRQGQAAGMGKPSSEASPGQPQGTQAGAAAWGACAPSHMRSLNAMLSAHANGVP